MVLLAALLPLFVSGQQKARLVRHQYEGALGASRIGMTIVREGNTIRGGHYFYQKFLKNIPITGWVEGSEIVLTEPGKGSFRLHFVGNGSEGQRPLDFENSIGMDGAWTSADANRTYTVSLRGTTILEGADDGHRYSTVTSDTGAAFESRVQSFCRAVLRSDRSGALRFISYPLSVHYPDGTSRRFRSRKEVLHAWDHVFTPELLAKLAGCLPHDMFVHEGMAMLGNGDAWFNGRGLAALNIPPSGER